MGICDGCLSPVDVARRCCPSMLPVDAVGRGWAVSIGYPPTPQCDDGARRWSATMERDDGARRSGATIQWNNSAGSPFRRKSELISVGIDIRSMAAGMGERSCPHYSRSGHRYKLVRPSPRLCLGPSGGRPKFSELWRWRPARSGYNSRLAGGWIDVGSSPNTVVDVPTCPEHPECSR